jgi:hypothetical protein
MNYYKQHIIAILFFGLIMACKKSAYLTDSGVHDPVTPLSNYDYLKANAWRSFDSLLTIIDHYNLKEEVNQAPTFFAPTNYSIRRYFVKLAEERIASLPPLTFDSLYNYINADSVRQYLFGQSITLESTSTNAELIPTKGNTTCAVQKVLQTAAYYSEWGRMPVYSLYYIKVRGALDDPNAPPQPNDPDYDTRVLCQTTGIQTSNGNTILHVLANTHLFVRF